jgi:large subunit ribosomal protein L30
MQMPQPTPAPKPAAPQARHGLPPAAIAQATSAPKAVGVVLIRGKCKIIHKVEYTLLSMNLTKSNHCVIVPFDTTHKGMLRKVKDYVTWGPIDKTTLKTLILKRGRIVGDAPLTEEHIKKNSQFKSVDELVDAIISCKASLKDVKDAKPLFRLHPPAGGFHGSIKKDYRSGGTLGDRGEKINELLNKMIEPKVKEMTAKIALAKTRALAAKKRLAETYDSSRSRERILRRRAKRRGPQDGPAEEEEGKEDERREKEEEAKEAEVSKEEKADEAQAKPKPVKKVVKKVKE